MQQFAELWTLTGFGQLPDSPDMRLEVGDETMRQ